MVAIIDCRPKCEQLQILRHIFMASEAPIYVCLLYLLRAVKEASAFCTLSADEEQLLGELIAQWHDTGSINVTEAMSMQARQWWVLVR